MNELHLEKKRIKGGILGSTLGKRKKLHVRLSQVLNGLHLYIIIIGLYKLKRSHRLY